MVFVPGREARLRRRSLSSPPPDDKQHDPKCDERDAPKQERPTARGGYGEHAGCNEDDRSRHDEASHRGQTVRRRRDQQKGAVDRGSSRLSDFQSEAIAQHWRSRVPDARAAWNTRYFGSGSVAGARRILTDAGLGGRIAVTWDSISDAALLAIHDAICRRRGSGGTVPGRRGTSASVRTVRFPHT
jgi:hypothetical protein